MGLWLKKKGIESRLWSLTHCVPCFRLIVPPKKQAAWGQTFKQLSCVSEIRTKTNEPKRHIDK
jgi:hypothetical protein